MTDKQITDLAREHVKGIYRSAFAPSYELYDTILQETEHTIRFILKRFCIVEKEQLVMHYNMAKSNIKPQYLEACQYEVGATEVLESLFPELLKKTEI